MCTPNVPSLEELSPEWAERCRPFGLAIERAFIIDAAFLPRGLVQEPLIIHAHAPTRGGGIGAGREGHVRDGQLIRAHGVSQGPVSFPRLNFQLSTADLGVPLTPVICLACDTAVFGHEAHFAHGKGDV